MIKGGNFLENHIEKIVLGAVGIVCIWLVVADVVISPNHIKYSNEKFGPGDIDLYINKQADLLETKLNAKPQPPPPYSSRRGIFAAEINRAVKGIDANTALPLPNFITRRIADNRKYTLPEVGLIVNIAAENIRAVAYIPTETITEERIYSPILCEPNDIDLVTVEAEFDVSRLYKNFYNSFAGAEIPEKWRDPCLAAPVFAAVELQRQTLLDDGTWSDWETVPVPELTVTGQNLIS